MGTLILSAGDAISMRNDNDIFMNALRLFSLIIVIFFGMNMISIPVIADTNMETLLEDAKRLYNRGDYENSLAKVDAYLIQNATNASALNLHGLILMDKGDYENAQLSFESALKYSEDQSMVQYNLGLNNYLRINFMDAEKYFLSSLNSGASFYDLLYYLGLVQYEMGKYNDSMKHLQGALEQNPHSTEAWLALGKAYEKVRQFDKAIWTYDQVLSFDPLCAESWYQKGNIYLSFGNSSQSRMAFENYTRLRPDDDVGWFLYARSLFDERQVNESIHALEQAIALNPTSARYHEYLKAYSDQVQSDKFEFFEKRPSNQYILFFFFLIVIFSSIAIFRNWGDV